MATPLARPSRSGDRQQQTGRWLVGFAIAVVVGQQAGVLFKPLGDVGPTRWADWIDLLTPYAVLGCAGAALVTAGSSRRAWAVFALGAVLFTQGHGIHLAANSVGNVAPGRTEHLWDEVVSHYIWYAGLAFVVAALGLALAGRPLPRRAGAYVLAAVVGLTLTNNAIEGGTPLLGLTLAVLFTVWGWRRRRTAGALMLVAYGVSLVLLVGWGVYWRGFPQFSELGWI